VAAQPLFIVAYIPLVVLAWHTLRCEPEVNRRRAWGAFIVGSVIGLGALGFQAYVVLQSTPLAFARNPSIVDLFLGIVPGPTAVIAGTSVIIGGIYSVKSVRELRSVLRAPFFVWLWVLLAPIGFFLGSQCLPAGSFWVPRYWGWQSAGLALLIGIVLGRMVQARHGWIAALVLVAGLTWRELGREWKLEGWREVASTIHQQSGDKSPPLVLLASGLVEQRDEMWILDPKHRPYLASPLAMYDVSLAEVLPVLESTEEKMEKFFRGQVIGRVGDRERLWLVGMQGSKAGVIIESGVLRKYTSLIQEMGFEARERREFGLVMLYEFHRKVSSLG
jgi:hypothetical protein